MPPLSLSGSALQPMTDRWLSGSLSTRRISTAPRLWNSWNIVLLIDRIASVLNTSSPECSETKLSQFLMFATARCTSSCPNCLWYQFPTICCLQILQYQLTRSFLRQCAVVWESERLALLCKIHFGHWFWTVWRWPGPRLKTLRCT
jgi:hypothetical protein